MESIGTVRGNVWSRGRKPKHARNKVPWQERKISKGGSMRGSRSILLILRDARAKLGARRPHFYFKNVRTRSWVNLRAGHTHRSSLAIVGRAVYISLVSALVVGQLAGLSQVVSAAPYD